MLTIISGRKATLKLKFLRQDRSQAFVPMNGSVVSIIPKEQGTAALDADGVTVVIQAGAPGSGVLHYVGPGGLSHDTPLQVLATDAVTVELDESSLEQE
jgi:hypothetical protein